MKHDEPPRPYYIYIVSLTDCIHQSIKKKIKHLNTERDEYAHLNLIYYIMNNNQKKEQEFQTFFIFLIYLFKFNYNKTKSRERRLIINYGRFVRFALFFFFLTAAATTTTKRRRSFFTTNKRKSYYFYFFNRVLYEWILFDSISSRHS